jgi:hypothetical protein
MMSTRNIISMVVDSQNVTDFQVKWATIIVWIGELRFRRN